MEKLTWDRVVPVISTSVSWLTFVMISFLAKISPREETPSPNVSRSN
jgi:hypothetical protein